jgi:threonine dehydrogenase-like Zn-dependent dehydrogenase
MRAAVMRGKKLVVDTVPDPVPGPGEVLVKTLACGICGSDLHALRHLDKLVEDVRESGAGFNMDPGRDIVMGHEFCAEIVEHGPNSQKTLKPGTRVCSMPVGVSPGGIESIGYSNDYPGGYAEAMVLSEMLLLEVPNGLSTERAALTEPMAVGIHAVEKANLSSDDLPLVIGCGPVGLAVIAGLKLKGVGPILAADFSPMRRKLAETLGADVVIDPGETSPYETWKQTATPEGYDASDPLAAMLGPGLRPGVIFECVGVPGVLHQIMRGAYRNSRVVVAGVCMEDDRIRPSQGIGKELNLQFVLGYSPDEFAATLRNIAEGKLPVEPLITGKVGVEGVPGAFEELANPEKHAKILVEPWHS